MPSQTTATYPDISVRLTGMDGNAFGIIARVEGAIRKAHGRNAADAFRSKAMQQDSYDRLLQLVMRTVEVE